MRVTIVLLTLLIAACDGPTRWVSPPAYVYAEALCQRNDGLKYLRIKGQGALTGSRFITHGTVVCNDGAYFNYSFEQDEFR